MLLEENIISFYYFLFLHCVCCRQCGGSSRHRGDRQGRRPGHQRWRNTDTNSLRTLVENTAHRGWHHIASMSISSINKALVVYHLASVLILNWQTRDSRTLKLTFPLQPRMKRGSGLVWLSCQNISQWINDQISNQMIISSSETVPMLEYLDNTAVVLQSWSSQQWSPVSTELRMDVEMKNEKTSLLVSFHHCTALHCVAVHCTALYCIELHRTALAHRLWAFHSCLDGVEIEMLIKVNIHLIWKNV